MIREFIRPITGRIAFERNARLTAVHYATKEPFLNRYGSADVALVHVYCFLLTGEFPH